MRTHSLGSSLGIAHPIVRTLAAAGVALFVSAATAPLAMAQGPNAQGPNARAPKAQPQAKLDDPTIIAIFDAANTWDIEAGNLALKQASDTAIRGFAHMMVRDHTTVRQQGRDLAKKLGVTPTPPKDFAMAKDHLAAMKQLHSLTGAAFDKAYIQNEVTYHKAVIDAITTTLLPAIQNAQLKTLVTTVAPAFQAHLVRAQQLLDIENKKSH